MNVKKKSEDKRNNIWCCVSNIVAKRAFFSSGFTALTFLVLFVLRQKERNKTIKNNYNCE